MKTILAMSLLLMLVACIRVTYKNGEQEMLPVVGAGPCLPCGEL